MLGASMNKILVVLLTLVLRPAASKTCNGLQEICSLRFDQVTFAGTHNSGSGFDGILKYSIGLPAISCFYRNQDKSFTQQLEAGIRFFDIDPCMKKGIVWTCHNTAYAGTMYKVFKQMGDFLKTNKNDVIVIRISDIRTGVDTDKLIKEMEDRFSGRNGYPGLSDYKARTNKFPTINQAIAEDKRVFVFMTDAVCDACCMKKNAFVLSQNIYLKETWKHRPLTSSCNGVVKDIETACAASCTKQFVVVSVFGSYGVCISRMAELCNKHVEASVESCLTERRKLGRYVNFIIVDFFTKAPAGKSVVDVANAQNRATAASL